jgi:serine O-acetyltransferase
MLLRLHSAARWCYLHRIPVLPRLIQGVMFVCCNCILPPECSVAKGTSFHHHGASVIVHPSVDIGENCNIYNQVVIGGGHDGPDGPPIRIIIGNRVNICAGAKILCKSGTLTIGDRSTIAANAVVLSNIPSDTLAVGIPARCIEKKRTVNPELEPALAITSDGH